MELNFFLIILLILMQSDYLKMHANKERCRLFTLFTAVTMSITLLSIILTLSSTTALVTICCEILLTFLSFLIVIFYIHLLYLERILVVKNYKRFFLVINVIAITLLCALSSHLLFSVSAKNSSSLFTNEIFVLIVFIVSACLLTIKIGIKKWVSWKIRVIPFFMISGIAIDIFWQSTVFIAAPFVISLFFIYTHRATHMLNIDPLTGIYNRRFIEINDNLVNTSSNKALVFFIDIDKFKLFNDTYGHKEGDIILQAVGNILKNSVRETDYCIRMGGDEFAIIVNNNFSESMAEEIISRINNGLNEFNRKSQYHNISLSIGWEICTDNKYKEAIKRADEKMYEKKHSHN